MVTKKLNAREEVLSLVEAAVRCLTEAPTKVREKADAARAGFMALTPADRGWVLMNDTRAAAFFVGAASAAGKNVLRLVEK
ncbi:MAG TPA: hypothetical protein VMW93_07915 [bacterium]|nr:hypothetical protein [bacterium]